MTRQSYLEMSAASLAAVWLYVGYTRVLSFKVSASFALAMVGIALLGLGVGSALVASFRKIADRSRERLLVEACLLGAACVLVACVVVATVPLDASAAEREPVQALELVGVCCVLALPFVAVGITIGSVLATAAASVQGKLYGAALAACAVGASLSVFLLEAIDPARLILLAGAVLALAAAPVAAKRRAALAACIAVVSVLLLSATVASRLPDALVDQAKGFERYREAGMLRTTRQDSLVRVDVADEPGSRGERFTAFSDGVPSAELRRLGSVAYSDLDSSSLALPFLALSEQQPRVLVLGSGSGREIVAALHFGAAHVTAVDVNGPLLSLVVGEYAGIVGRLHENPKVSLVHADPRSFLMQSDDEFDLIFLIAPDALSTTGAAAVTTTHAWTIEMMSQVFRHLASGGIVCAQLGERDMGKPHRTVRFLSTARQFYYEERIPDYRFRIFVVSSQRLPKIVETTVVLSRSSLTGEQNDAIRDHTLTRMPQGAIRFKPGDRTRDNVIQQVILMPPDVLWQWHRTQPYRFLPVRDDSPFFWHYTSYWDAVVGGRDKTGRLLDHEDGRDERLLVVAFLASLLLGVLLLLVPRRTRGESFRALPNKASLALAFTAFAVGSMFTLAAIVPKLSLLLGFPTRSLTVTCFAFLLSAGVGAAVASRYTERPHRASGVLLAFLFALLSLWHLAAPLAVQEHAASSLVLRLCIAVGLVAPVGLVLGGFVPAGLAALAKASARRELVAWAVTVHLLALVAGTFAAVMLAMMTGFKFLLVAAPIIYATGVLALLRVQSAPSVPADVAASEPLG